MAQMSRRLTAHDSVFLNWERPEQPMHVAECMIYQGHLTADDMIRMIRDRIHLLPRYRQKVVAAPFGLAHPTWEDDPSFDVANHVDEQTLTVSEDDEELSRTCGRLFCGLLERNKPMWHLTVLHGYKKDVTVVFLKLHHAMVDGVSSVELIEVLHSTKPGATPPPPPRNAWQPQPVPNVVDRLREVAADQASTAAALLQEAIDVIRPGGVSALASRAIKLTRAVADVGPLTLLPMSPTPFNQQIHARRDFAWVELDQDEVKHVREALGGTVNDLVLAVLSGALARYMRRHGSLTDGRTLNALCPVSVRKPEKSGAMGNQISMVIVPLHIGLDNGGHRLRAEHESMQDLKRRGQAEGIHEVITAMKWVPAPIFKWVYQNWPQGYFPTHITSTNVPGPKAPLYLGDHELLHWYPFGVQWTNNGLFLCTLSYRGKFILGPVADPDVVPDVWSFAADLRASFEEIKSAAGLQARPGQPETTTQATASAKTPSKAATTTRRATRKAATATAKKVAAADDADARSSQATLDGTDNASDGSAAPDPSLGTGITGPSRRTRQSVSRPTADDPGFGSSPVRLVSQNA